MTYPIAAGNDLRGQASARRRDGIRRSDELLDAALTCFSERGLLGTRIEDIRRAARASPSSVYNLFDGLPSLTVALLARTFERLFAHVTSRARAEDRPNGAVRALVDGHLEWVLGHEDEARFMYGAMALELATAQREELAELKAKLAVPVMEHLASIADDGALPAWPASTLEFMVLGPAHEACRRYLAGTPVDLAGLRGLLPDVAWESVRAFAAADDRTGVGESAATARSAPSGVAASPQPLVEALRAFAGLWVAVRGDEVLVAAPTPAEVVSWLTRYRQRAEAMFRVPGSDDEIDGVAPQ